jgi:hypothetical protein
MRLTYCRNALTASFPYIILLIIFANYNMASMKKQVYTFEKEITLPSNQFGTLVLSISKYTDCLLLFINQTGAIGSIVMRSL